MLYSCGDFPEAEILPESGEIRRGRLAGDAQSGTPSRGRSDRSWFWLLTRYSASRPAVFTFLSPLFGTAFGVLLLGESVGWHFMSAAALVLTGIAPINAPPRRRM